MQLLKWLEIEDWKRGVALVILWAYAWQLVMWAPLTWFTTLVAALTGTGLPVPPLLPWELLATGTATLGTVGGIQTWREKVAATAEVKQ